MEFTKCGTLDPDIPISVNMEGGAKLPPKTMSALFQPHDAEDQMHRWLGVQYVVKRGKIRHLRLTHLSDDEEFWWLMMLTAINVEAGK